jgi:hypothetical protein
MVKIVKILKKEIILYPYPYIKKKLFLPENFNALFLRYNRTLIKIKKTLT